MWQVRLFDCGGEVDRESLVRGRPNAVLHSYFHDFTRMVDEHYSQPARDADRGRGPRGGLEGVPCDVHTYCCVTAPQLLQDVRVAAEAHRAHFFTEVFA